MTTRLFTIAFLLAAAALTSCQSTGSASKGPSLHSYFDTCGVGSTWRFEGTIRMARRTGPHQQDMADVRTGRLVVERTLTERRADELDFTCRAWIGGQQINTTLSADWQSGNEDPDKQTFGPINSWVTSKYGELFNSADLPMPATASTVIERSDKFHNFEIRFRPNVGTQTINGRSVPVGTIERWQVLKQPTLGLRTSRDSTVWVNDSIPGRVTRFDDGDAIPSYDISLKSYKIVPR